MQGPREIGLEAVSSSLGCQQTLAAQPCGSSCRLRSAWGRQARPQHDGSQLCSRVHGPCHKLVRLAMEVRVQEWCL